jgi:DNA-directed RNA polymerase subunit beta
MSSLSSSFSRPRKLYQRVKPAAQIPYLIEVQKDSYQKFLQAEVDPDKRQKVGLQAVFRSVFPIKDPGHKAEVDFVRYWFEEPKFTVDECRQRGMSYVAPIKVVIRLSTYDADKDSAARPIRDVKEQDVFFGEIPLMTKDGTFIINGTERVVVSQLHRSAGVFFDHDKGKNATSLGKVLYSAHIIPYRGSWLDIQYDSKDLLQVRIDKKRKMPATVLLKALGMDEKSILHRFYKREQIKVKEGSFEKDLNIETLRGQKLSTDLIDPKDGRIILHKGKRVTAAMIRAVEQAGIDKIVLSQEQLVGSIAADEIVSKAGKKLATMNQELDNETLTAIGSSGVKSFEILSIEPGSNDHSLRETLLNDKCASKELALEIIHGRIRPGDPVTKEGSENLFKSLFFAPERYDLGTVGRMKLNQRLGINEPLETMTLTNEDILTAIERLIALHNEGGDSDDIDNLSNRRVRAVGELLENQYRIGLLRIERAIKDRLNSQELDTLMPQDFINNKPVGAVVREFFGSSQLSQFMDQTNPLSEVTHKRRLSALGPGGLNRDRAAFEVRDVHPTHYGRICPVETPEGPNIGLISSLASYAQVDKFGFIETPYKNIKENRVDYYSANEEHRDHIIAQASDLKADADLVYVRKRGESQMMAFQEADLMDVSTNQLVSVAASLIPFLQNDDANRALMGSNMQRQAVPLLKSQAPLIGTGMERVIARDSGATVVVERDGVVDSVDSERIVVKTTDEGKDVTEVGAEVDIYKLQKFKRSNVDTCINQKVIVRVGEKVKKGDIIADGFATEMGELALGQNVVVAFMPWGGYNFEDSILISERVVKEDLFTSIHIQEFECISRDTKLGSEEITGDIPNVGEEALKDLDESGIIRVGAEVRPHDLLVGKITPKGETQLTPEEKLLRAIFGEKAGDVRDTSLRVPPGVVGTVIGAKVFAREGTAPDSRSLEIETAEIEKLRDDETVKIKIIKDSAAQKVGKFATGELLAVEIKDKHGEVIARKGQKIDSEFLSSLDYGNWEKLAVQNAEKNALLQRVLENLQEKVNNIRFSVEEQIRKTKKGDELPPGVIKMVKVYVAIKRKLQVGDKMAGRHGNKGVVSRILPEEDLPFLSDGRPVDVVLNPLGVPSRMNVGQILETHLGWAAKGLGERLNRMIEEQRNRAEVEKLVGDIWSGDKDVETFVKKCSDEDLKDFARKYRGGVHLANPVFDGASETDIQKALENAELAVDGSSELYDGLTGERFENKVTVGVMYVLKLHHLVDEKIHARSIGPYSLVTQQPLGGKAQFGGQRLGEMEVWAMEAYGAAHMLQEFLTVKSDDVMGRTRMYESIVKGQNMMNPGLPESFNVLVKELQSLALNIELKQGDQTIGYDSLRH